MPLTIARVLLLLALPALAAAQEPIAYYSPAWSPDGRSIAFESAWPSRRVDFRPAHSTCHRGHRHSFTQVEPGQ